MRHIQRKTLLAELGMKKDGYNCAILRERNIRRSKVGMAEMEPVNSGRRKR
ncbi:hypothetical protein BBP40_004074 [Aspergillus hancockii]|nr:hypothetical protein BBP40_004074 [Aspergillus hancockii]